MGLTRQLCVKEEIENIKEIITRGGQIKWKKVSIQAQRFLVLSLIRQLKAVMPNQLRSSDFTKKRLDILGISLAGLYNYYGDLRKEEKSSKTITGFIFDKLQLGLSVEEEVEGLKKLIRAKKHIYWRNVSLESQRYLVLELVEQTRGISKPSQLEYEHFTDKLKILGITPVTLYDYYRVLRKKARSDKPVIEFILAKLGLIVELSVEEEVENLRLKVSRDKGILWANVSKQAQRYLIQKLMQQLKIPRFNQLTRSHFGEKLYALGIALNGFYKHYFGLKKAAKSKKSTVEFMFDALGLTEPLTIEEEIEGLKERLEGNKGILWRRVSADAQRYLILELARQLKLTRLSYLSGQNILNERIAVLGVPITGIFYYYRKLRNKARSKKTTAQFILEELGLLISNDKLVAKLQGVNEIKLESGVVLKDRTRILSLARDGRLIAEMNDAEKKTYIYYLNGITLGYISAQGAKEDISREDSKTLQTVRDKEEIRAFLNRYSQAVRLQLRNGERKTAKVKVIQRNGRRLLVPFDRLYEYSDEGILSLVVIGDKIMNFCLTRNIDEKTFAILDKHPRGMGAGLACFGLLPLDAPPGLFLALTAIAAIALILATIPDKNPPASSPSLLSEGDGRGVVKKRLLYKEAIRAFNRLFYLVQSDLPFTTPIATTPIIAKANAREFHSKLTRLNSGGKLPDKILIYEWGIGDGNSIIWFIEEMLRLDQKYGTSFARRIIYKLFDFSETRIGQVRTRLERSGLRQEGIRFGIIKRDLTKAIGFSETPLLIRAYELYDDLPNVEMVVKKNNRYYEAQVDVDIDYHGSVTTREGRALTKRGFIEDYLLNSKSDMENLVFRDFQLRPVAREVLVPIEDITQHPYFDYINSHLGDYEEGRLLLNIGALNNLRMAISILDRERGGYIDFSDYAWSLESHTDGILISHQPTAGVNFRFLEYEIMKDAGVDFVTESQGGYAKRFLTKDELRGFKEGIHTHAIVSLKPGFIASYTDTSAGDSSLIGSVISNLVQILSMALTLLLLPCLGCAGFASSNPAASLDVALAGSLRKKKEELVQFILSSKAKCVELEQPKLIDDFAEIFNHSLQERNIAIKERHPGLEEYTIIIERREGRLAYQLSYAGYRVVCFEIGLMGWQLAYMFLDGDTVIGYGTARITTDDILLWFEIYPEFRRNERRYGSLFLKLFMAGLNSLIRGEKEKPLRFKFTKISSLPEETSKQAKSSGAAAFLLWQGLGDDPTGKITKDESVELLNLVYRQKLQGQMNEEGQEQYEALNAALADTAFYFVLPQDSSESLQLNGADADGARPSSPASFEGGAGPGTWAEQGEDVRERGTRDHQDFLAEGYKPPAASSPARPKNRNVPNSPNSPNSVASASGVWQLLREKISRYTGRKRERIYNEIRRTFENAREPINEFNREALLPFLEQIYRCGERAGIELGSISFMIWLIFYSGTVTIQNRNEVFAGLTATLEAISRIKPRYVRVMAIDALGNLFLKDAYAGRGIAVTSENQRDIFLLLQKIVEVAGVNTEEAFNALGRYLVKEGDASILVNLIEEDRRRAVDRMMQLYKARLERLSPGAQQLFKIRCFAGDNQLTPEMILKNIEDLERPYVKFDRNHLVGREVHTQISTYSLDFLPALFLTDYFCMVPGNRIAEPIRPDIELVDESECTIPEHILGLEFQTLPSCSYQVQEGIISDLHNLMFSRFGINLLPSERRREIKPFVGYEEHVSISGKDITKIVRDTILSTLDAYLYGLSRQIHSGFAAAGGETREEDIVEALMPDEDYIGARNKRAQNKTSAFGGNRTEFLTFFYTAENPALKRLLLRYNAANVARIYLLSLAFKHYIRNPDSELGRIWREFGEAALLDLEPAELIQVTDNCLGRIDSIITKGAASSPLCLALVPLALVSNPIHAPPVLLILATLAILVFMLAKFPNGSEVEGKPATSVTQAQRNIDRVDILQLRNPEIKRKIELLHRVYCDYYEETTGYAHPMPEETTKGIFVVSLFRDVAAIFDEVDIGKRNAFIDLGSGDGRIAFLAAIFGIKSVFGIEYTPRYIKRAEEIRVRLIKAGLEEAKNVNIVWGDYESKTSRIIIGKCDTVFHYDPDDVNARKYRLAWMLSEVLSDGALIVNHTTSLKPFAAPNIHIAPGFEDKRDTYVVLVKSSDVVERRGIIRSIIANLSRIIRNVIMLLALPLAGCGGGSYGSSEKKNLAASSPAEAEKIETSPLARNSGSASSSPISVDSGKSEDSSATNIRRELKSALLNVPESPTHKQGRAFKVSIVLLASQNLTESIPLLIAVYNNSELLYASQYRMVIRVLRDICQMNPEVWKEHEGDIKPLILKALVDSEYTIRIAAIKATGAIGIAEARRSLLEIYRYAKDAEKIRTVIALARLGEKPADDILRSWLATPGSLTLSYKIQALAALVELGDGRCRNIIERLARDASGNIMEEIGQALVYFGSAAFMRRRSDNLKRLNGGDEFYGGKLNVNYHHMLPAKLQSYLLRSGITITFSEAERIRDMRRRKGFLTPQDLEEVVGRRIFQEIQKRNLLCFGPSRAPKGSSSPIHNLSLGVMLGGVVTNIPILDNYIGNLGSDNIVFLTSVIPMATDIILFIYFLLAIASALLNNYIRGYLIDELYREQIPIFVSLEPPVSIVDAEIPEEQQQALDRLKAVTTDIFEFEALISQTKLTLGVFLTCWRNPKESLERFFTPASKAIAEFRKWMHAGTLHPYIKTEAEKCIYKLNIYSLKLKARLAKNSLALNFVTLSLVAFIIFSHGLILPMEGINFIEYLCIYAFGFIMFCISSIQVLIRLVRIKKIIDFNWDRDGFRLNGDRPAAADPTSSTCGVEGLDVTKIVLGTQTDRLTIGQRMPFYTGILNQIKRESAKDCRARAIKLQDRLNQEGIVAVVKYIESKDEFGGVVYVHYWVETDDGCVLDPTLETNRWSSLLPNDSGVYFKGDKLVEEVYGEGIKLAASSSPSLRFPRLRSELPSVAGRQSQKETDLDNLAGASSMVEIEKQLFAFGDNYDLIIIGIFTISAASILPIFNHNLFFISAFIIGAALDYLTKRWIRRHIPVIEFKSGLTNLGEKYREAYKVPLFGGRLYLMNVLHVRPNDIRRGLLGLFLLPLGLVYYLLLINIQFNLFFEASFIIFGMVLGGCFSQACEYLLLKGATDWLSFTILYIRRSPLSKYHYVNIADLFVFMPFFWLSFGLFGVRRILGKAYLWSSELEEFLKSEHLAELRSNRQAMLFAENIRRTRRGEPALKDIYSGNDTRDEVAASSPLTPQDPRGQEDITELVKELLVQRIGDKKAVLAELNDLIRRYSVKVIKREVSAQDMAEGASASENILSRPIVTGLTFDDAPAALPHKIKRAYIFCNTELEPALYSEFIHEFVEIQIIANILAHNAQGDFISVEAIQQFANLEVTDWLVYLAMIQRADDYNFTPQEKFICGLGVFIHGLKVASKENGLLVLRLAQKTPLEGELRVYLEIFSKIVNARMPEYRSIAEEHIDTRIESIPEREGEFYISIVREFFEALHELAQFGSSWILSENDKSNETDICTQEERQKIFCVQTQEDLTRKIIHYNYALDDAISKYAKYLFCGGDLYEIETGRKIPLALKAEVLSADFSPCDMYLAVTYRGKYSGEIFDVEAGSTFEIEGLSGPVEMWGEFSSKGTLIPAYLADGAVAIVNVHARKVEEQFSGGAQYCHVYVSKGERYVDIYRETGSEIFDRQTQMIVELSDIQRKIGKFIVMISSDDKHACFIGERKKVVYEFATREVYYFPDKVKWAGFVDGVANSLFIHFNNGRAKRWNYKTGDRKFIASDVYSFSVSPTGDSVLIIFRAATADAKDISALYYPSDDRLIRLDMPGVPMNTYYSHNGRYLLFYDNYREGGSVDNLLYEVATAQRMPIGLDECDKPFFSVDGSVLVVFRRRKIVSYELAAVNQMSPETLGTASKTGLKIPRSATVVYQEGVLEIRVKKDPEDTLTEITFIRPGYSANLQTWILQPPQKHPYDIANAIVNYLRGIDFDLSRDEELYGRLPRYISGLSDASLSELEALEGPVELYDVLGVSRKASAEEIKAAYRELAFKNHPDINIDDAQAEQKMKEINCAYEILSDPEKRLRYDLFGDIPGGRPSQGYNGAYRGTRKQFRNYLLRAEREDITDAWLAKINSAFQDAINPIRDQLNTLYPNKAPPQSIDAVWQVDLSIDYRSGLIDGPDGKVIFCVSPSFRKDLPEITPQELSNLLRHETIENLVEDHNKVQEIGTLDPAASSPSAFGLRTPSPLRGSSSPAFTGHPLFFLPIEGGSAKERAKVRRVLADIAPLIPVTHAQGLTSIKLGSRLIGFIMNYGSTYYYWARFDEAYITIYNRNFAHLADSITHEIAHNVRCQALRPFLDGDGEGGEDISAHWPDYSKGRGYYWAFNAVRVLSIGLRIIGLVLIVRETSFSWLVDLFLFLCVNKLITILLGRIWRLFMNIFVKITNAPFISGYAMLGEDYGCWIEEDFAETYRYAILHEDELREKASRNPLLKAKYEIVLRVLGEKGSSPNPYGYFGNLNDSHIQAIEALVTEGKFEPIEEFNELLPEFEGTPVRFFSFSECIPRAPPEDFIWGRMHNGALEIYFSSEEFVDRFQAEFADNLPGVLEAVSFHEFREIHTNSHKIAERQTQERYPDGDISIRDGRLYFKDGKIVTKTYMDRIVEGFKASEPARDSALGLFSKVDEYCAAIGIEHAASQLRYFLVIMFASGVEGVIDSANSLSEATKQELRSRLHLAGSLSASDVFIEITHGLIEANHDFCGYSQLDTIPESPSILFLSHASFALGKDDRVVRKRRLYPHSYRPACFLRQFGFPVDIYDVNIDGWDGLIERLSQRDYEFVSVTPANPYNQADIDMINLVARHSPGSNIFLGGESATMDYANLLSECPQAATILGFGSAVLLNAGVSFSREKINPLCKHEQFSSIRGLVFIDHRGRPYSTGFAEPADNKYFKVKSRLIIYRHPDLVDYERYWDFDRDDTTRVPQCLMTNEERILARDTIRIVTRSHCPRGREYCIFCGFTHFLDKATGSTHRVLTLPAEDIRCMIGEIAKAYPRFAENGMVFFNDDDFLDIKQLDALLDCLSNFDRRRVDIKYFGYTVLSRFSVMDKEDKARRANRQLLNRLYRAGFRKLLYGAESFSPRILRVIRKYPENIADPVQMSKDVIYATVDEGIIPVVTIMLFAPMAQAQDVRETTEGIVDIVRYGAVPNVYPYIEERAGATLTEENRRTKEYEVRNRCFIPKDGEVARMAGLFIGLKEETASLVRQRYGWPESENLPPEIEILARLELFYKHLGWESGHIQQALDVVMNRRYDEIIHNMFDDLMYEEFDIESMVDIASRLEVRVPDYQERMRRHIEEAHRDRKEPYTQVAREIHLARGYAAFFDQVNWFTKRLKGLRSDYSAATVVFHNDADGIAAGAIMQDVMRELGYDVSAYSLEMPFTGCVEQIYQRAQGPVLFVDLEAGSAQHVNRCNLKNLPTFMITHHGNSLTGLECETATIDPVLSYRVSAGPNFDNLCRDWLDMSSSSATICWFIAKSLGVDRPAYTTASVIGSLGDKHHYPSGRLIGLDGMVVKHGVENDLVKIETRGEDESYYLKLDEDGLCEATVIEAELITPLGIYGYSNGGIESAVEFLSGRLDLATLREKADDCLADRNRLFAAGVGRLREGALQRSRDVQWFDDGGIFHGMAVQAMADFLTYLCVNYMHSQIAADGGEGLIDNDKYIFGFKRLTVHPQLGAFERDATFKLSIRYPDALRKDIESRLRPGSSEIAAAVFVPLTDRENLRQASNIPGNLMLQAVDGAQEFIAAYSGFNTIRIAQALVSEFRQRGWYWPDAYRVYLPIAFYVLDEMRVSHSGRVIVTAAGPTGTGKTTFDRALGLTLNIILGESACGAMGSDNFFYSEDRFDELGFRPDAYRWANNMLDTASLFRQFNNFRRGRYIHMPLVTYKFEKDSEGRVRSIRLTTKKNGVIVAQRVLLTSGVSLISNEDLPGFCDLYQAIDVKVFLDADIELIGQWRIQRDRSFGIRSDEEIRQRWERQLRPRALEDKRYIANADIVLTKGQDHKVIAVSGPEVDRFKECQSRLVPQEAFLAQGSLIRKAPEGISGSGRRLGILSSSFDPLRNGHLELAQRAAREFGLDEIIFVMPARPRRSSKNTSSGLIERLLMVKSVVDDNPYYSLGLTGEGIYTEIVKELQAIYPQGTELYIIKGSDAMRKLIMQGSYYERNPDECQILVGGAYFIVGIRTGFAPACLEREPLFDKFASRIRYLSAGRIIGAISSTEIRGRARNNQDIADFVPEQVASFIQGSGMYSQDESVKNDVSDRPLMSISDPLLQGVRRSYPIFYWLLSVLIIPAIEEYIFRWWAIVHNAGDLKYIVTHPLLPSAFWIVGVSIIGFTAAHTITNWLVRLYYKKKGATEKELPPKEGLRQVLIRLFWTSTFVYAFLAMLTVFSALHYPLWPLFFVAIVFHTAINGNVLMSSLVFVKYPERIFTILPTEHPAQKLLYRPEEVIAAVSRSIEIAYSNTPVLRERGIKLEDIEAVLYGSYARGTRYVRPPGIFDVLYLINPTRTKRALKADIDLALKIEGIDNKAFKAFKEHLSEAIREQLGLRADIAHETRKHLIRRLLRQAHNIGTLVYSIRGSEMTPIVITSPVASSPAEPKNRNVPFSPFSPSFVLSILWSRIKEKKERAAIRRNRIALLKSLEVATVELCSERNILSFIYPSLIIHLLIDLECGDLNSKKKTFEILGSWIRNGEDRRVLKEVRLSDNPRVNIFYMAVSGVLRALISKDKRIKSLARDCLISWTLLLSHMDNQDRMDSLLEEYTNQKDSISRSLVEVEILKILEDGVASSPTGLDIPSIIRNNSLSIAFAECLAICLEGTVRPERREEKIEQLTKQLLQGYYPDPVFSRNYVIRLSPEDIGLEDGISLGKMLNILTGNYSSLIRHFNIDLEKGEIKIIFFFFFNRPRCDVLI